MAPLQSDQRHDSAADVGWWAGCQLGKMLGLFVSLMKEDMFASSLMA